MRKKKVAITLGIMCLILTFGIMIQLNTTNKADQTAARNIRENGLRDEVLKWKEKYDIAYEKLEQAQTTLEEERKKSVSKDADSVQKQEELKQINTALGLNDVTGRGIIITIKDNNSGKLGDRNDIIHDSDLKNIINELKNSGAQAISINDQRIVHSTAITCVGSVIQVNNEKVGSPFIIKAIGNQDLLWNVKRPGGFLEILEYTYGIPNETKKVNNVSIPKYSGVLTDKYLESIK